MFAKISNKKIKLALVVGSGFVYGCAFAQNIVAVPTNKTASAPVASASSVAHQDDEKPLVATGEKISAGVAPTIYLLSELQRREIEIGARKRFDKLGPAPLTPSEIKAQKEERIKKEEDEKAKIEAEKKRVEAEAQIAKEKLVKTTIAATKPVEVYVIKKLVAIYGQNENKTAELLLEGNIVKIKKGYITKDFKVLDINQNEIKLEIPAKKFVYQPKQYEVIDGNQKNSVDIKKKNDYNNDVVEIKKFPRDKKVIIVKVGGEFT